MISIVQLKEHVANASILDIIVSKFRYIKKLYSIILLKIDKNLEINFYYIILPFSLIIYLWIKDDRKSLLDTKKIA